MGGQSSSYNFPTNLSLIPADMSTLPAFQQFSGPVQSHFQVSVDALLAMGVCISAMAKKIDASVASYLMPEEKAQFNKLMADKAMCVNEVDRFVRAQRLRYVRMTSEVKTGVSLTWLVRNSCTTNQAGDIERLITKITQTRQGFKTFSDELEENCRNDGRASTQFSQAAAACISGILTFVVGVAFAAAIICHFIPGVHFVMFASHVVSLSTVFAACATTTALCLRQDELQRGQQYLSNMEENLRKLRTSVQDLGAENDQINDDMHAEEMTRLINSIVGRCDTILRMSEQV